MTIKATLYTLAAIGACVILTTGYYRSHEDSEDNFTFFLKKYPTHRMEFINVFATEGERKVLEELRADQRLMVIEYCRYRLGINTTLNTQAELDACNVR